MFETEQNQDRRHDPALKHYLRSIGRFALLTKEEEADLAKRIRGGDQAALDDLINGNLRFVVSVAKRYLGRGLSLMDLIAEGNVGLITAARRFDERREFRFVTYAVWWIRQTMQAALQDQTRTVRLPANRSREAQRIAREERRLVQERMGAVDDAELSEVVGIAPRIVARIRAASRPNQALDVSPHEGAPQLAETLPDPAAGRITEELDESRLRAALGQALERLTDRERHIISHYYGLDGAPVMSLEAIGQSIRISRERVRQIRNRAFDKLRAGGREPALADFLA